jgi:hypothetical protein
MASVCSISNHSYTQSIMSEDIDILGFATGPGSFGESSNDNSIARRDRKIRTNIDSDFHKVVRYIPNNGNVRVAYYKTRNIIGRDIRNAITGVREVGYKVGSKDEDLFFTVIMATGENGTREPHFLYYNNPEQWERHFHTMYPQDKKEEWQAKYQLALQRKNKEKEPKNVNVNVVIHG